MLASVSPLLISVGHSWHTHTNTLGNILHLLFAIMFRFALSFILLFSLLVITHTQTDRLVIIISVQVGGNCQWTLALEFNSLWSARFALLFSIVRMRRRLFCRILSLPQSDDDPFLCSNWYLRDCCCCVDRPLPAPSSVLSISISHSFGDWLKFAH